MLSHGFVPIENADRGFELNRAVNDQVGLAIGSRYEHRHHIRCVGIGGRLVGTRRFYPRIFCGLSHIFRQHEIWLDNRAVGGRLIGDVQGGAQLRH